MWPLKISNCDTTKTQIMTKLKNSNCDETKKKEKNLPIFFLIFFFFIILICRLFLLIPWSAQTHMHLYFAGTGKVLPPSPSLLKGLAAMFTGMIWITIQIIDISRQNNMIIFFCSSKSLTDILPPKSTQTYPNTLAYGNIP